MKKNILLLIAMFAFVATAALAQMPSTLNLQGLVTDSDNKPLNGNVDMEFRLYTDPAGTAVFVEPLDNVTVQQGYYNIRIGVSTNIPNIKELAKNPLWYELTIEGVPQGKVAFDAVPYAFGSQYADTAAVAEYAKPIGVAGGDLDGTYPNPTINEAALNSRVEKIIGTMSTTPKGPANGEITGYYPSGLLIKDGVIQTKHISRGAITETLIADGAVSVDKLRQPYNTDKNQMLWWNSDYINPNTGNPAPRWEYAELNTILSGNALDEYAVPVWDATTDLFRTGSIYDYYTYVRINNLLIVEGKTTFNGGATQFDENIVEPTDVVNKAYVDVVADALAQEILDRIAADEELQDNIDAVVDVLAQEILDRIAADEELQDNIDAVADVLAQEILDRIAADEALQDNIDIVAANLETEIANRIAADAVLQTNINNEEAARIARDNELQQAIDDEEAARIAQDLILATTINNEVLRATAAELALSNRITADSLLLVAEIANRIAADEALQDNIDIVMADLITEIASRIAADEALQDNIDIVAADLATEIANRIAADEALQDNIDIVAGLLLQEILDRIAADVVLQDNIDTEEASRIDADALLQDNIDAVAGDLGTLETTIMDAYNNNREWLLSVLGVEDQEPDLSNAAGFDVLGRIVDLENADFQSQIDDEETARIDADNDLQSQINAMDMSSVMEIDPGYGVLTVYPDVSNPNNETNAIFYIDHYGDSYGDHVWPSGGNQKAAYFANNSTIEPTIALYNDDPAGLALEVVGGILMNNGSVVITPTEETTTTIEVEGKTTITIDPGVTPTNYTIEDGVEGQIIYVANIGSAAVTIVGGNIAVVSPAPFITTGRLLMFVFIDGFWYASM